VDLQPRIRRAIRIQPGQKEHFSIDKGKDAPEEDSAISLHDYFMHTLRCHREVGLERHAERRIHRTVRVETDEMVLRKPVHAGKVAADENLPVTLEGCRIEYDITKTSSD
jgi:hypothetical protein